MPKLTKAAVEASARAAEQAANMQRDYELQVRQSLMRAMRLMMRDWVRANRDDVDAVKYLLAALEAVRVAVWDVSDMSVRLRRRDVREGEYYVYGSTQSLATFADRFEVDDLEFDDPEPVEPE